MDAKTAKIVKENLQKQKGQIPKIKESSDVFTLYNVVNTETMIRTIFFALTEKQAIKVFLDTINSDHQNSPEDFTLVKVGTWNKVTGVIKEIDHTENFVYVGHFQKQIGDDLQKLINSLVERKINKMIKEKGGKS